MTQAPVPVRRPLARAALLPLGVLAGVGAAVAYVAAVDPHEPGHYPTCPFLALTGLYCPGCGALRMVNSAAHGRFGEAFGSNPLTFLTLPVLGYLWARWLTLRARGEPMRSRLLSPGAIGALLAVIVVYGVVRNLPFGQALAP
ncbi:hypothetical protein DPM19_06355 [Actinomadura craniellae]|uniref:DUF2752 domain-containing protein n=1 Tax=Actinomadura craniellae TaxID=2231787 RepID=A0A365HDZ8_9ACTN|nr:DUF2752 domain-containing protein [Actinomadura craniellae]RAY16483.1 hypothetical protein DPM19_06355 [Actinomadura craniellae]